MAKTRPLSLSISESLRKCNAGTTTTTTTTINNTRVRRRINSEKRCHYTFSETRNPRISYEDPSKPSWVEALVATLDKPEEGDDDDEITLDPRLRKDSLGFCQESKSPCDNSPSQSIHKNSVAFGQEIVCVDSLNWEDQKDSVGFGQRIRDPYEKILNQRFQSGSSGSGQESCLRLRKGSYREIQDQCENVSNRNCQKDSSEDPCGKVLSRRLRKNSSGFSREIQELCEKGEIARGLEILLHMDRLRILPCERDYFHLLKGCSRMKSLLHTKQIIAHLARHGFEPATSFLGEYIVIALAKCGALEDAFHLFQSLASRSVYSWTALINSYTECNNGQKALEMYGLMKKDCVEPNEFTFVSLLKACGNMRDLNSGRNIHADARRRGFESDIFIGSTLVSMYGKCGDIKRAESVFKGLSARNIVSWNAMLSAYVDQGQEKRVLDLYKQMKQEGTRPKEATFVIAIQACSLAAEKEEGLVVNGTTIKPESLKIGRSLHNDLRRKGFQSHAFVGSSLVNMYGKCGAIKEAEDVFRGLCHPDVVSWTSLLSAYVIQGEGEKVLDLYKEMQEQRTKPDEQTLVMALQGCSLIAEDEEPAIIEGQSMRPNSLAIGRSLHSDVRKMRFDSNVFVASSLVMMYSKCGDIIQAENVFNSLHHRDNVAWNAMLTAYVDQGQGSKALKVYKQMQAEGASLCDVTFVCALQACSELGDIETCGEIYFNVVSAGCHLNLTLAALIHAYGSCSRMVNAQAIFDNLVDPDVVIWSTLIAGYCREGNSMACLERFKSMEIAGIKPDRVTFLSLLSACSHAGLVDAGVEYFGSMKRNYALPSDPKHFVCLFDLLGRAGDFRKLKGILPKMPVQPDIAVWLCLLASCRTHGNMEVGKFAFDCAVRLQPKEPAAYVLMSNIYADAGMFDSASLVDLTRQKVGAWEMSSPDELWCESTEHSFRIAHKKGLLGWNG